ncbi:MAG: heavy-metal-associated domain-containing protein [Flavobacteriales bacterium]
MKKIAYLMLSTILFLSACSNSATDVTTDKTEISAENLVVADYVIEGMVCAVGCAKTIEEEIGALSGVAVSLVDYESGKAHFEFDKLKLSEKEIIAKIESLADGQYKVSEWKESVESTDTTSPDASENTNTENEDKTKVKVNLPGFQIPNLFTFLINQV